VYEKINNVIYWTIEPPAKVRNHFNMAFDHFKDQYDYFLMIGDDNLFKIYGWEQRYVKELQKTNDWGIAYSDNGYHGSFLATTPLMSTKFIKTLGYIAYPELNYDYVDDVLQTLTTALDIIHYIPEVYIEHLHPAYGKGSYDSTYSKAEPYRKLDAATFADWKKYQFDSEVQRIKSIIEKDWIKNDI
jgi:hypothetical protein